MFVPLKKVKTNQEETHVTYISDKTFKTLIFLKKGKLHIVLEVLATAIRAEKEIKEGSLFSTPSPAFIACRL